MPEQTEGWPVFACQVKHICDCWHAFRASVRERLIKHAYWKLQPGEVEPQLRRWGICDPPRPSGNEGVTPETLICVAVPPDAAAKVRSLAAERFERYYQEWLVANAS